MRQALVAGVLCFNVESESELDRLDEIAREMGRHRANERARQPGRRRQDASLHLDGAKGEQVRRRLRRSVADLSQGAFDRQNLKVVGIDCHIGSQLTELAPFVDVFGKSWNSSTSWRPKASN